MARRRSAVRSRLAPPIDACGQGTSIQYPTECVFEFEVLSSTTQKHNIILVESILAPGSRRLVSMSSLHSRTVFSLLLLFGQCTAVLHAAEFGTDAHHHDGIFCSAVLHEDFDTPTASRSGGWRAGSAREAHRPPVLVQGKVVCTSVFRPPATGPPSI